MSRKMILSLFLLAILAVFRPERVSANALPYQWEGAQGSEILVMEDCPLQVKGETLLFQLEPQTSGHTLQSAVTAVYSLYNPTNEPCTVPAVFPIIAAQRLENEQQVLLNGEPLPCRLLPDSEPWQEWTAGFFNLPEEEGYSGAEIRLLDFTLELAPGETARLEVRSATQAFMERDVVFHYVTTDTRYTFYYFLSPAQYWDSFEKLEIELQLSSAAPVLTETSLPFRWAGFRKYRYESSGLPQGELSFTASLPAWIWVLRIVLGIVLAVAAILLIVRIKRWLSRKFSHPPKKK